MFRPKIKMTSVINEPQAWSCIVLYIFHKHSRRPWTPPKAKISIRT